MRSQLPEVPPVYNSPKKQSDLPRLMTKLQWGLLKILILVATGVAGILIGQRLTIVPQKTPVARQVVAPTPITSIVSNWKTYSNSKYGFSFDYPQEWPEITEETVMSNSGKLYDQVNFGDKFSVNVKDETMNTPYTLSEYANNPSAKNVALEKYPAYWLVQFDGDVQIDIARDLKTVKIVSLVFPFGTNEQIITQLLSSFSFDPK